MRSSMQKGLGLLFLLTLMIFVSPNSAQGQEPPGIKYDRTLNVGLTQISDLTNNVNLSEVCWNGNGFGTIWVEDQKLIYFRPLDKNGKPTVNARLLYWSGNYQLWNSAITYTKSHYLVAFVENENKHWVIKSVLVEKNGDIKRQFKSLTKSGGHEHIPRLAWNGKYIGMVYLSLAKTGNWEVRFRRLTKNGAIKGSSILLSSNANKKSNFCRVVWDGKNWGATWLENDLKDLKFQKISSTGKKIGSAQKILSYNNGLWGSELCPGKNGDWALVFEKRYKNKDLPQKLCFVRLDNDGKTHGKILDLGTPNPQGLVTSTPAITYNEKTARYIVAWQDNNSQNEKYVCYQFLKSTGKALKTIRLKTNTGNNFTSSADNAARLCPQGNKFLMLIRRSILVASGRYVLHSTLLKAK